ncbi:MAG TPA: 23S rRNA (uracil(1939)-C(5))-methyltransferase RlmD [Acidobacteriota bacterium]|nr:23S rRNA (uracil(1939)-C(5))-methyltransferase RlmD [Acidobacteriota bacterium]
MDEHKTQTTVTPACPYFGTCGGCTAQHIAYEVQVANKRALAARVTGQPIEKVSIFSGDPYHYRNRMDFIFTEDGFGLRKEGKWQSVIPVEACTISNTKINDLIKEVRTLFPIDAFNQKTKSGTFKYIVIRATKHASSLSFVVNMESMKIEEAMKKIEQFAKVTTADNILFTYVEADNENPTSHEYIVMKGSDMLTEDIAGKTLTFSTQAFFQNNSQMASEMILYTKSRIEARNLPKSHLLDLYGGVGTFGIALSDVCTGVTIVESVAGAIDAAKINIEKNKVNNAKALLMDAAQLKKLQLPSPLIIVTDPPRTGMDARTIDQINRLSPDLIIYVSCNPHQLEKELPRLKPYDVASVAVFDLFPQTNHSEIVVELVKKK